MFRLAVYSFIFSAFVAVRVDSAYFGAGSPSIPLLQRRHRACTAATAANASCLRPKLRSADWGAKQAAGGATIVPSRFDSAPLLQAAAAAPAKQKSSPEATPSNSASVQYMITNKMRQTLINDLAYLPGEVDEMEPEVARIVISKRLRRPPSGMPKAWSRSANAMRLAKRSRKSIIRTVVDPFVDLFSLVRDAVSNNIGIEGIKFLALSACFGVGAYKIFYSDDSFLRYVGKRALDTKELLFSEDYISLQPASPPRRVENAKIIDAERLSKVQSMGLGERVGMFFNVVKNKYL